MFVRWYVCWCAIQTNDDHVEMVDLPLELIIFFLARPFSFFLDLFFVTHYHCPQQTLSLQLRRAPFAFVSPFSFDVLR